MVGKLSYFKTKTIKATNSPLQQEKDKFHTSKKNNERYAACSAPQEVKDSSTGLVGQVVKFQRRFKCLNSCAHTGNHRVCCFESLSVRHFSDPMSHASHLGGATITMQGNGQRPRSKGGAEEMERKAAVEAEAAEHLKVCSSLDLTTASKQTWIMPHRNRLENALAALCRGKTCHRATTPASMQGSFF